MIFGPLSEIGPLRRVALRHARDAFRGPAAITAQWRALDYPAPPDFDRATQEYDCFAARLRAFGVKIEFLPPDDRVGLDSIYVRDASLVTPRGIVACAMGKAVRALEPAVAEEAFRARGLPILGAIEGEGRIEGGDVVWLDDRTLVVGRGYRTNDEGIRQLRVLLAPDGVEVVSVPLPHWRGPADVFHLMSMLSPLDRDLVLVHAPLLPVPFREWLIARGLMLIEVAESEFATMACNVLALGPRRCLVLAGNPRTRARLEAAGVVVHEYEGEEISRKGAGGPTCLTRPLVRA